MNRFSFHVCDADALARTCKVVGFERTSGAISLEAVALIYVMRVL